MLAIAKFELKSYLSNKMALFWTVGYPVAMLALLIAAFDPGIATDDPTESYRFRTTVGLVTLTIVSTALFGMGQAISEMRTQKAMIPYMFLPVTTFSVIMSVTRDMSGLCTR